MNDDFIHQFDPPGPPRSEFSAALYQRITQPMKTPTRTRILRAAALSFALFAVLVAALFALPSTRAFADSIIQKFQKGNLTIQTGNDAAAASRLAGFTVLAPSYLPEGYIALDQPGGWTVATGNGGARATINYENQAAGGNFAISEQKVQPGESNPTMNGVEPQSVTVRGQPGTWLSAGSGTGKSKSILAWDEKGIRYSIGGDALTKDEALKVAESLGK